MPARLSTLVVLVALLSAAGFGCSGELTRDEYRDELEQMSQEAEQRFQRINALGSEEPDAASIREEAQLMRETADEFEDVTPPAEVKDLHADTVSVLRDLADLIEAMGELVAEADGDPNRLLQLLGEADELTTEASEIVERMQEIETGYADAGYGEAFQPLSPEAEASAETATDAESSGDIEDTDSEG